MKAAPVKSTTSLVKENSFRKPNWLVSDYLNAAKAAKKRASLEGRPPR